MSASGEPVDCLCSQAACQSSRSPSGRPSGAPPCSARCPCSTRTKSSSVPPDWVPSWPPAWSPCPLPSSPPPDDGNDAMALPAAVLGHAELQAPRYQLRNSLTGEQTDGSQCLLRQRGLHDHSHVWSNHVQTSIHWICGGAVSQHVFQLLLKMLGKEKCGWKFWVGNFRTNLMAIKCGLVPPCQGRSQATPKTPAMVQQVPGRDKVGDIFWGSSHSHCGKLAEVTSLSPQVSQHREVRPFVIWSKDHLPGPGAHTLSNWDNPIQLGDLIASGC